jgi:hypothetical protein
VCAAFERVIVPLSVCLPAFMRAQNVTELDILQKLFLYTFGALQSFTLGVRFRLVMTNDLNFWLSRHLRAGLNAMNNGRLQMWCVLSVHHLRFGVCKAPSILGVSFLSKML